MTRTTGTYSAPANSWNPAVEGTPVDETDWNAVLDDIEAALTESVYTGGLGATDNRLVRTDGTDTKKVQSTGVTVDDSNNVSGVGTLDSGAITSTGAVTGTELSASTSGVTTTGTIELGHASDTTIARSGAGDATIEGNAIYRAGGTDISLADGGTGASLTDPGADRIMAWDDTAGTVKFMPIGDLTAEAAPATGDVVLIYGAEGDLRAVDWSALPGAGAGSGDVVGPASATDNAVARFNGTGGKTLQDSAILVGDTVSGAADVSGFASMNTGPLAGLRNRLINGGMQVNQRQATSNADDTYGMDRWNILTQTGTVAVSQITAVEDSTAFMHRITQSQASAQRFGVSQIIENANCSDLRGQAVTLSARVRCSASTTLRYAVLEWTGTADTVTSDVVLSWTSGTFTAGNFFNSTTLTVTATGSTALTAATLATVSLSTTLGSSGNNVIVFFWTDSTQAQNVTLDVGKVQFEHGATATVFERRPYSLEYSLCQRYMRKSYAPTTAPATATTAGQLLRKTESSTNFHFLAQVLFSPPMLATPTLVFYNPNDGNTTNPIRVNSPADVAASSVGPGATGFVVQVDSVSVGATLNIATHYTAIAEL